MEQPEIIKINKPKDMIGLKLNSNGYTVTVCGIVDTGLNLDRYEKLKGFDENKIENFAEQIAIMALESELNYARRYSLDGMMMVTKDFINDFSNVQILSEIGNMLQLGWSEAQYSDYLYDRGVRPMSTVDKTKITWLDGQERTELADDELVISREMYFRYIQNLIFMYAETQPEKDPENPDFIPGQAIPPEYDFDRLRDEGNGFGKLANAIFTLKAEETKYLQDRFGLTLPEETRELKLVGIIEDEAAQCFAVLPSDYTDLSGIATISQTLSPMPTDSRGILSLVEFSAVDFDPDDKATESYDLMNPVSFELKNLDMIFKILKKVFFWIGLVFVLFASLLFSNFIATSISYKKEEIGILRAIGSRGNDVFRIFFAESFIIAMINFILSFLGTVLVCLAINLLIKSSTGILLTVLTVSIRQAILLFGVCLLSAFIACYLPVRKIAAKRPIDAIRDR